MTHKNKKWHNIKTRYKLSKDTYIFMLMDQKHKCYICGKKAEDKEGKGLCVDHSHETNNVRGLLCKPCNTMLGVIKEDVKLIKKMLEYLQKHTGYK